MNITERKISQSMTARGIKSINTITKTTCSYGVFKTKRNS